MAPLGTDLSTERTSSSSCQGYSDCFGQGSELLLKISLFVTHSSPWYLGPCSGRDVGIFSRTLLPPGGGEKGKGPLSAYPMREWLPPHTIQLDTGPSPQMGTLHLSPLRSGRGVPSSICCKSTYRETLGRVGEVENAAQG